MSRVLITGATGFVGANLVYRLLKKGHKIHIICRPASNFWRLEPVIKKIKYHTPDLTDIQAITAVLKRVKPQIIYHLAAYGTYPVHKNLESVITTNIVGSFNLFQAAQTVKGIKIIVSTGSSSEYGPKTKPMKETDWAEPNTLYGAAKLSQTFLAQYFSRYGTVPIVTLRLFSVYGPYEEPGRLIPTVLTNFLNRRPLKLGAPWPRRDFIYIEDVLEALEKAARRPDLSGAVLNIGTSQDYSIKDVVAITAHLTKTEIPIDWGATTLRSFDRPTPWRADTRYSRSQLGWRAKHSFEQGLKKSINWFRDNARLYK